MPETLSRRGLGSATESRSLMQRVLDSLISAKNDAGHEVSEFFMELPERSIPGYYKIVKRPMSLLIVQKNVENGKYKSFAEFVRDVEQIVYNAKLFNRKASIVYEDAVALEKELSSSLEILHNESVITSSDAQIPKIGPLPRSPGDEEGSGGDDDEDEDEEAEPEEDDDEDDDDDEPTRTRRSSRRKSRGIKRRRHDDEEDHRQPDERFKKRGRPPTVDKPHESRIKSVLRGIRKVKDNRGRLLYLPFDRLPDLRQYPEYYREIRSPIALDGIRKSVKRRQYPNVESFVGDMNLMFENAKAFNSETSQLYADAMKLQEAMVGLVEEEMKKPDSVYQDPESNTKASRIPLDGIEHRGEIYKVGDWVHISNLNDPSKPTVAQIFRTWQAADGQKWINACWYFRPEQTVHRYDKLFYENEVVKSGQYRDHLIDEVLEKCFVMFFTKYQRGRPTGIGNRAVYCCESRYNETEKTFNKIRTWKACIPDEIRGVDYQMDVFEKPQPLKKVPSPIKHLLPPNATEKDPVPEPTMGVENAPPVVGAVYKRPPDPSEIAAQEAAAAAAALHAQQQHERVMAQAASAHQRRLASPGSITPGTPQAMQVMQNNGGPPGELENLTMTQMYKQAYADNNTPIIMTRGRGGSPDSRSATPMQMITTMPFPQQQFLRRGSSRRSTIAPLGQELLFQQQPQGYYGIPPYATGTNLALNSTNQQVYTPPAPPSAFTLPDHVSGMLDDFTQQAFDKEGNNKSQWYIVPPVDTGADGLAGSYSVNDALILTDVPILEGHSAEYLAFKEAEIKNSAT